MDSKLLKKRIVFRRLIQGLVLLTIFSMAVIRVNHENDLFWQLKMGEDIVVRHFFPISDPYNLSNPGAVWTLEEWIPSVLFYSIFTYLGAPGLIILKAIVVTATFFLFMLLFNKQKVNLYLSLIVLFLAAMVNTRGFWGIFPSIFEYLFIVFTLFLLEIFREKKTKFIPLGLILFSFVWVQFHASFFLLTLIVGSYLFGDIISALLKKKFKRYKPRGNFFDSGQRIALLKVFLASFITPFLHPNGFWMAIYPFRITFGKFTSYVSEYQRFWNVWSWNFSDYIHGFTLILMVILGIILAVSYRKIHVKDILLALVFGILALTAVRHVAIFALIALFIIGHYITVWFGEYRGVFKRSLFKDVAVILLILFFIIFYKTRLAPFSFAFSEEGYPKKLAEIVMNNNVTGNMFNHYNYGGYLIWKMKGYKVFIDGRLEMYQGKAGDEYLTILNAKEGYKELLKKYNINFFIDYVRDPLVEALIADSSYKYIHSDQDFVLFVKSTEQNKRLLSKYWSKEKEEEFRAAYKRSVARFRAEEAHNEGLKAVKAKNHFGALYYFQQAVNLDPSFAIARFNLSKVYIDIGMYESAISELKAVVELDPKNYQAVRNLRNLDRIMNASKIR